MRQDGLNFSISGRHFIQNIIALKDISYHNISNTGLYLRMVLFLFRTIKNKVIK
jgi:hypothetical protein